MTRLPIRVAGLTAILGLAVPAIAAAEEGLNRGRAVAPAQAEIRHWDSVIDRTTRPVTDGLLTEAQRNSYLRNEVDPLDPETPRIKPLKLPKARLSTRRNLLGQPLP